MGSMRTGGMKLMMLPVVTALLASPPATPKSEATSGEPATTGQISAARVPTSKSPAAGVHAKGLKTLAGQRRAVVGSHALKVTFAPVQGLAEGQGFDALQDDDLNTAWTCEASSETCAIGMLLDQASSVRMLRLFPAAGPKWHTFRKAPRAAKIRVHTDAGYVDAELPDGAGFRSVVFDPPLETKSMGVEVLETHGKYPDHPTHIAEIDVFADAGSARPALDIDPATVGLFYESSPWLDRGDEHLIRHVYITASTEPDAARLFRGTALYGQKGDQMLLVERWMSYACGTDVAEQTRGYALLDQTNRIAYAIQPQRESQILRHPNGTGFAFVRGSDVTVAVLIDGKVFVGPLRSKTLADLGFDASALAPVSSQRVRAPDCE